MITNASSNAKIVTYKAEALNKISAVPVDELGILKRETIASAKDYIEALETSELGKNQLTKFMLIIVNRIVFKRLFL